MNGPITTYSVVCCDLLSIHTALIYIERNSLHDYPQYLDSIFHKLYGNKLYGNKFEQIHIDETAFIQTFRELLNQSGYKTSVLPENPDHVVVYYNDGQQQEVHQLIENNFLTDTSSMKDEACKTDKDNTATTNNCGMDSGYIDSIQG